MYVGPSDCIEIHMATVLLNVAFSHTQVTTRAFLKRLCAVLQSLAPLHTSSSCCQISLAYFWRGVAAQDLPHRPTLACDRD
jgi:hypothetical protein